LKALALGHQTVCHLLFKGWERKRREKAESTRVDFFLPKEKIINAFIDSIKMKDYCIASRSFSLVAKGQKEKRKAFGMKMEDYV
jgi:hypothetical protein